ncbi:hypothetical protein AALA17_02825 [Lactobacillaceae bacterium 24-114]
MSMVRKFKAAKLQLTMVGDNHPKGVKHLFNNVSEQVGEEQINLFRSSMESLTKEKVTNIDLIDTQAITIE